MESHLLQMRGLKLMTLGDAAVCLMYVASFTDAWIETHTELGLTDSADVASFTDAWIETSTIAVLTVVTSSHLLQMRGLKQVASIRHKSGLPSRIFYRCVD